MKKTELKQIPVAKLVTLKRNPQYLTPKQMESLKASIQRDGFCAPILVRPIKGGRYEVISGNHRFMASSELKMTHIPCVIVKMTDATAKRLAVNLNTIHGDPNAELLAPFLAEMDDKTLLDIHLSDEVMKELEDFDAILKQRLDDLKPIDAVDTQSPGVKTKTCKCPKCGTTHVQKEK
jgi:ParB/RepB/Spo0J family partition protein